MRWLFPRANDPAAFVSAAVGALPLGSARVNFRRRYGLEPFLNNFLDLHDALALPRTVENQRGQVFDPVFNEVALLFERRDVILAAA